MKLPPYTARMKYECCQCKKDFPVEAAIDGFKEGYRVGFLCPLCGANVQDNLTDTHRIYREGRGYIAALAFFGFVGITALRIGDDVSWPYIVAFVAALAVAIAYGYSRYPSAFTSPVFSTRPGSGKENNVAHD